MSTAENIKKLDVLVEAAVRGLFHGNGLSLGPPQGDDAREPDDHDIAASIGFTAPRVQGAILMTTRKELVAAAWPQELRPLQPTERQVCDWAGELVNQLLGRLKNALVPFGLVLEQSSPTVVLGKHVHRAPPTTNVARRYFFSTSVGCLLIFFDASMAKALALSGAGALQSAAEGELQLF